jgi:hypothetical protein
VAELVDALASGASGLTAVKVRVLSWAPFAHAQTSEMPLGLMRPSRPRERIRPAATRKSSGYAAGS